MSVAPGSMSIILPIVERVTRLPGQALVLVAAGLDAAVLAVGWLAGRSGDSVGAWIPFIFGVLAAISILVFGVLRYRLEKRVEKTAARFGGLVTDPAAQSRKPNDDGATSRDVVVVSQDGRTIPGPRPTEMEEELRRVRNQERAKAARQEAENKRKTFMPRIEAAQRAAIAAAGGTDNAPYLKDDLRITIISALTTMMTVPLSFFFILVGLVIWV